MNKLFKNLLSKDAKTKYTAQREILKLSYENPKALYEDFDFFVKLLSHSNTIFVWTGLLALGNLSSVDKEKKIDTVLESMIAKLNTGKMITAGNALKSLIVVGKSRPDLANHIAEELIKIKNYEYDTEECRNILLGLLFASIFQIWDNLDSKNKDRLIQLANANTSNTRNATAKKAERFLYKTSRFGSLARVSQ
jgi:hypothetical protein